MPGPVSASRRRLALCLLSIGALQACATGRPAPPRLRLSGLAPGALTPTAFNLMATLNLENPNGFGLTVSDIVIALSVLDQRLANSRIDEIALPAHGSIDRQITISVPLPTLRDTLRTIRDNGDAPLPYRLDANLRYLGLPVTLARTGEIALPPLLRRVLR